MVQDEQRLNQGALARKWRRENRNLIKPTEGQEEEERQADE